MPLTAKDWLYIGGAVLGVGTTILSIYELVQARKASEVKRGDTGGSPAGSDPSPAGH